MHARAGRAPVRPLPLPEPLGRAPAGSAPPPPAFTPPRERPLPPSARVRAPRPRRAASFLRRRPPGAGGRRVALRAAPPQRAPARGGWVGPPCAPSRAAFCGASFGAAGHIRSQGTRDRAPKLTVPIRFVWLYRISGHQTSGHERFCCNQFCLLLASLLLGVCQSAHLQHSLQTPWPPSPPAPSRPPPRRRLPPCSPAPCRYADACAPPGPADGRPGRPHHRPPAAQPLGALRAARRAALPPLPSWGRGGGDWEAPRDESAREAGAPRARGPPGCGRASVRQNLIGSLAAERFALPPPVGARPHRQRLSGVAQGGPHRALASRTRLKRASCGRAGPAPPHEGLS